LIGDIAADEGAGPAIERPVVLAVGNKLDLGCIREGRGVEIDLIAVES
jgi:hypothetical protein